MSIIGISGKKQSGKDTVGRIIQYILSTPEPCVEEFLLLNSNKPFSIKSNWKIKKFADTLKDIVCLLIGCTREDLENEDFKNKELGEEWWYYTNTLFEGKEKKLIPYLEANKFIHNSTEWYIVKLTPRLLLELFGTNCGRNIIHPNIWLNSLMSGYEPIKPKIGLQTLEPFFEQQNWIVTDVRFPNENTLITDKGGIVIRINRFKEGDKIIRYNLDNKEKIGEYTILKTFEEFCIVNSGTIEEPLVYTEISIFVPENTAEAETALDRYSFIHTINSIGTIEDLYYKVKNILHIENLI